MPFYSFQHLADLLQQWLSYAKALLAVENHRSRNDSLRDMAHTQEGDWPKEPVHVQKWLFQDQMKKLKQIIGI